jgi:EAL domain-containing protein (putative c-di-GMP-specific phosphodiesterase class I)
MFDLVVRMLDETGQEVLPSEFLAAAERIDLMKNIDRWVVGAAMSFCASRKPHRVFVRLSRDSIQDQTLGVRNPRARPMDRTAGFPTQVKEAFVSRSATRSCTAGGCRTPNVWC